MKKKIQYSYQYQGGIKSMKKKFSRKLFAVLIAVCMMVLCIPVTSQAAIRVSAPRLKSAQNTSSGISLNWTRVSNASGYVIYRNNKYIAGVITEVTLTEIMSVNPNTTTIIRCDKSTFCTCYISECFNKLCASIFESISLRCSNKTAEKDLIRDRDIL